MEGYLVKEGGGTTLLSRKSLKLRWFVLINQKLVYFKDDKSVQPMKDSGIDLRDRHIWVSDQVNFTIMIGPQIPVTRRMSAADRNDNGAGNKIALSLKNVQDTSNSEQSQNNNNGFGSNQRHHHSRGSNNSIHDGSSEVVNGKDSESSTSHVASGVVGAYSSLSFDQLEDSDPNRTYIVFAYDKAALVAWYTSLFAASIHQQGGFN
jgi:hypothetical protein